MPATPEKVWEFLLKVGEEIRELRESIRELREGDRELRERDRELRERNRELQEYLRKMEEERRRESLETERKIRELSNLFTTQWGKLVEALVEPGAVNLFRQRGIKVRRSARRIEVEDEEGRKIAEYDIFLENDREVVIIEVKTTVKKEEVDELLKKLDEFKKLNPKYEKYQVYGAIAGITFDEGVDRYAYKKGLFVLKSEGGLIRIVNDPGFSPRIW